MLYTNALDKEGTTENRCIKDGEPYTPEEDYRKSLENLSEKEDFEIPCRLNSEAFKTDICDKKEYKTPEQIAQDEDMDVDKIKEALKTCGKKEEFNAAQRSKVCKSRTLCSKPSFIQAVFKKTYSKDISFDQIKNMPCPAEGKNPKCPNLYD